MADFRIWGTITRAAPACFVVIASAVHDPPSDRADVRTGSASSYQAAEQLRDSLIRQLGAEVVARGDRVVDVEEIAPILVDCPKAARLCRPGRHPSECVG